MYICIYIYIYIYMYRTTARRTRAASAARRTTSSPRAARERSGPLQAAPPTGSTHHRQHHRRQHRQLAAPPTGSTHHRQYHHKPAPGDCAEAALPGYRSEAPRNPRGRASQNPETTDPDGRQPDGPSQPARVCGKDSLEGRARVRKERENKKAQEGGR